MIKMHMLLGLVTLLSSFAWAESCPTLAGVYECPADGHFDAFTLTLTQREFVDSDPSKTVTEYKYVYSTFMEYSLSKASFNGVWNQDEDIRYFAKCVGKELRYSDQDLNLTVNRRYLQKTYINETTGALEVILNEKLIQVCTPKSQPALLK